MSTPPSLGPGALATELAKLPSFSSTSSNELDPVRIAIARAVASGQDASQLAHELNTPAGWQSVDFSKPPVPQSPVASPQKTVADAAIATTPPPAATSL